MTTPTKWRAPSPWRQSGHDLAAARQQVLDQTRIEEHNRATQCPPLESAGTVFDPSRLHHLSDVELLRLIRTESPSSTLGSAAFAILFDRHSGRTVAWARTFDPAMAEDLAMDAFTKVLGLLSAGGGPDEHFGAYLNATVRNGFISGQRRRAMASELALIDSDGPRIGESVDHESGAVTPHEFIVDAFGSLPIRWQQVLWWLDVEGRDVEWVGDQLALKPNAIHALAFRARRGLRAQFALLQSHSSSDLVAPPLHTETGMAGLTVGGSFTRTH